MTLGPLPGGRVFPQPWRAIIMSAADAVALVAAVLALCWSPGEAATVGWSHARTVTLVMHDYRFAPSRLVLRVGVRYRLHVVNRGEELHELTAPAFFKAVTLGNPKALTPDLAVQPGETRDLYFLAARPGRFPFWCADHDWAGMVGKLTIE